MGSTLEIAKKAVFLSLVDKTIMDYDGRPVAQIGPVNEDIESNIIHQASQNMYLESMFIRSVIERIEVKFHPLIDGLLPYIYHSPVFMDSKRHIVEIGLKALIEKKDFITSFHLLVPQIEDSLRKLVELTGGPIYKPDRNGGLKLRTFDELTRDERLIKVLGEDGSAYLRIVFTDPRGWNLRNRVCHGIMPPDEFNQTIADRVLHVILFLSLVRKEEHKTESESIIND